MSGGTSVAPRSAMHSSLVQATDRISVYIEWLVRAIEVGGIAIVVGGALLASAAFVRALLHHTAFGEAYHVYRSSLGRAILLGLEFLVAADIIGTVAVEPTFTNLGVLAGVVLIRTFLSFSLEVEINGHWPWEDSARREGAAPAASDGPEAERGVVTEEAARGRRL